MTNLRLTELEIQDYIEHTITGGEYHIKEELGWLIGVLRTNNCNDALDSIREVALEWRNDEEDIETNT